MTHTNIPPMPSSSSSSSDDAEQLVQRVADLEHAQRTEDVEGFVALLDEDAVWVTGGGKRLLGREAIAAFTRSVLPGSSAEGSAAYVVEHIRFITPDVALTAVNQERLTVDGSPFSPRQEGRPSYVWRRNDGRWLIASGQNTGVAVDAGHGDVTRAAAEMPGEIAPEDEAEIRRIVADVELGFNTNDPAPMMRRIADDALVGNVLGTVLRGREAIESATRSGLSNGYLQQATAHYRLSDVALLSADVAVAHKNAWSTPAAADAEETPEMNALYVFARRAGEWWIVRRQNTLVHDSTVQ